MGLAASQCRLLSITSRMSDLELRSQRLSNQKVALSTEQSAASSRYINALNNNTLNIYTPEGDYTAATAFSLTDKDAFTGADQLFLQDDLGKVLCTDDMLRAYDASGGNLEKFLNWHGVSSTGASTISNCASMVSTNIAQIDSLAQQVAAANKLATPAVDNAMSSVTELVDTGIDIVNKITTMEPNAPDSYKTNLVDIGNRLLMASATLETGEDGKPIKDETTGFYKIQKNADGQPLITNTELYSYVEKINSSTYGLINDEALMTNKMYYNTTATTDSSSIPSVYDSIIEKINSNSNSNISLTSNFNYNGADFLINYEDSEVYKTTKAAEQVLCAYFAERAGIDEATLSKLTEAASLASTAVLSDILNDTQTYEIPEWYYKTSDPDKYKTYKVNWEAGGATNVSTKEFYSDPDEKLSLGYKGLNLQEAINMNENNNGTKTKTLYNAEQTYNSNYQSVISKYLTYFDSIMYLKDLQFGGYDIHEDDLKTVNKSYIKDDSIWLEYGREQMVDDMPLIEWLALPLKIATMGLTEMGSSYTFPEETYRHKYGGQEEEKVMWSFSIFGHSFSIWKPPLFPMDAWQKYFDVVGKVEFGTSQVKVFDDNIMQKLNNVIDGSFTAKDASATYDNNTNGADSNSIGIHKTETNYKSSEPATVNSSYATGYAVTSKDNHVTTPNELWSLKSNSWANVQIKRDHHQVDASYWDGDDYIEDTEDEYQILRATFSSGYTPTGDLSVDRAHMSNIQSDDKIKVVYWDDYHDRETDTPNRWTSFMYYEIDRPVWDYYMEYSIDTSKCLGDWSGNSIDGNKYKNIKLTLDGAQRTTKTLANIESTLGDYKLKDGKKDVSVPYLEPAVRFTASDGKNYMQEYKVENGQTYIKYAVSSESVDETGKPVVNTEYHWLTVDEYVTAKNDYLYQQYMFFNDDVHYYLTNNGGDDTNTHAKDGSSYSNYTKAFLDQFKNALKDALQPFGADDLGKVVQRFKDEQARAITNLKNKLYSMENTIRDLIEDSNAVFGLENTYDSEIAAYVNQLKSYAGSAATLNDSAIASIKDILQKVYDHLHIPDEMEVKYSDKSTIDYYTNVFNVLHRCLTEDGNGNKIGVSVIDKKRWNNADWLNNQLKMGNIHTSVCKDGELTRKQYNTAFNYLTEESLADELLAKAQADYEADIARISRKEKKIDKELSLIETEHNALEKQYDSIKQNKDDNIDRNFNIFS